MGRLRIYTVGWPHSGNKHLGRLLARALGDERPVFAVPRSRGGGREDGKCPAICHTHCIAWHEPRECLVLDNTMAYASLRDDERLVWTVRDPRDAAVSAWMSGVRSGSYAPGYSLLSYLAEHFTGAGNPSGPFCSWREHVEGWLEAVAREPRLTRTSHEALYADREGELRRILRALGLPEDGGRIREAVDRETGQMRPAYDGSGATIEAGHPGEWRSRFGAEEAWLLDWHCGELMRRLGYGRELEWRALTERV